MHDPVGPLALRRPPGVEDERLLHPDGLAAVVHLAVLARGLPVPPRRSAVGPVAGTAPAPGASAGDLAVETGEEVPLGVAAADAGEGGEVPGLETLEVDLGDGVDAEAAAENVATEIVGASLAATLLKAETWGISRGGGCARGARGGRGSRRRAPRRGRPRVWGCASRVGRRTVACDQGKQGGGRGSREAAVSREPRLWVRFVVLLGARWARWRHASGGIGARFVGSIS